MGRLGQKGGGKEYSMGVQTPKTPPKISGGSGSLWPPQISGGRGGYLRLAPVPFARCTAAPQ